MTEDLKRAIAGLEYCVKLYDGQRQPNNEFRLEPLLSLVDYARAVIRLAKEEPTQ